MRRASVGKDPYIRERTTCDHGLCPRSYGDLGGEKWWIGKKPTHYRVFRRIREMSPAYPHHDCMWGDSEIFPEFAGIVGKGHFVVALLVLLRETMLILHEFVTTAWLSIPTLDRYSMTHLKSGCWG
ncbi:BA75_00734T0 [Komagataella pastoris]|uniref:BA75_00734T0 n=1 Tax=Komagataella pastoris TaxID=4922 RepID=A0A1B2J646_PICPA|nr:BA75_00734T0 [Komagataella pastoris]